MLLAFPVYADPVGVDLTLKKGGLTCKFFSTSLKLTKEVTVYWRDLIEVTSNSMIFEYGDEVVVIHYGAKEPWICVPVSET